MGESQDYVTETRQKFGNVHFLIPLLLFLSCKHYHLSDGISALVLPLCAYETIYNKERTRAESVSAYI
jgi:hypothetical protein